MDCLAAPCSKATGQRYVGITTDGLDWRVYELRNGTLSLLRSFRTDPKNPRALLIGLDSAVALEAEIEPSAEKIRIELGRDSVAYRRVEADLATLWAECGQESNVALKRQLWRQLLALVYGQDINDDALWFQHTFLVIVAKAIAAKVVGLSEPTPQDLLSGKPFEQVGISGAAESDFFDWVLVRPQGVDLVRRIIQQVGRFRLRDVKTDVLKVLYESLIDPAQRHDLGEYYTPDWLATKMCRAAITKPLTDRIIDPACGSGTFLFHAVRMHLAAAEQANTDPGKRAQSACALIAGLDIHPVAVIIARVTYLLALGRALVTRKGHVAIPVYLGDALQLNVRGMFMGEELVVIVPEKGNGGGGGPRDLHFPKSVCEFPDLFDEVLEAMRVASEGNMNAAAFEARIKAIGKARGKEIPPPELSFPPPACFPNPFSSRVRPD
jgi:N-6 DNA methylase